jgi:endonuclease/exonuclease/phosphatase family metal-dependent hydrolase
MVFPHLEWVDGWDTNIQVAVLSRFPIVSRRSATNATYLHQGRRFHVSRGFGEVEIQVNARYRFVLLNAHLKSRRASPDADESQMRLEEAQLLRARLDALLAADPGLNAVVLGDFNDTKDSPTVRAVIGRAGRRPGLVDTRPAERNGDAAASPVPYFDPRHVTWTHYYGKEDTYSRIDYILLTRGMAREWVRSGTYVLALADWGVGSDHRPLVAEFLGEDR